MLNNFQKDVAIKMLNEFESQINSIIDDYNNKKCSAWDCMQFINWFRKAWTLSRVDVKNNGSGNQVKLVSYDKKLNITFPDWFKDERGQGSKIESENNEYAFSFECINDGHLQVIFKGLDYRNQHDQRLPVYFNFTSIKVNNIEILDENKLVWHNDSFIFNKNCINNEKISINVSCENIFDYYPLLESYLLNIKHESDLKNSFQLIKDYVRNEKKIMHSLETSTGASLDNNLEIYNLNKNYERLSLKFELYKKETDEILDSYNFLYNNLLIYHKTEPKRLVKLSRELIIQMLDFVDNVCKKYDLQWWLYAGTLLGAIRHQGFIPWDDDCDINMLREDYDKFFDLVTKEIKDHNLSDNMEVNKTTVTNNNFHLPFIKFNYWVGRDLLGFIDIFPSDYVHEIIPNLKLIFEEEGKKNQIRLRNGENRDEILKDSFERLHVTNEKTNILISGVEDPIISIHDYDSVFPLTRLQFEDRMYPCPKDYKTYIAAEYGSDYMLIPKEFELHGFYEYLSRCQDIYMKLEEELKKLKEANENF